MVGKRDYDTRKDFVEEKLKEADLVFTGVPDPNYRLKGEDVKEGSIAIDITSWNLDDSLNSKCKLITSKKDPIGKITCLMLLYNLLYLVKENSSSFG